MSLLGFFLMLLALVRVILISFWALWTVISGVGLRIRGVGLVECGECADDA